MPLLDNFGRGFLRRLGAVLFIISGCTDPVDPEFNYEYGLIYIDAFASTLPDASYVRIFESDRIYGIDTNVFQEGAEVRFVNADNGLEIPLKLTQDRYTPPQGFAVEGGSAWYLDVILADGRHYRSEQESPVAQVPLDAVNIRYDPELVFSDANGGFVPGHELAVSFQDPPAQENFYLWEFRSYERLTYCQTCFNYTIFRNGECFDPDPNSAGPPLQSYYTYACEDACWQIRYSNEIAIFSDEFVNGNSVTQLPVANVLLYQKQNILVELQQYALSREAYRYYKTLKDLVNNNSGLNAPLPAALLGNLYNPGNTEEYVLGRFTLAAQSSRTLFIERTMLEEDPLEKPVFGRAEEYGQVPDPVTTTAPCTPGPYRTNSEPQGWQE